MEHKIMKSEELQALTSSLAVLLHAGISLQEGFTILFEEDDKHKDVYAFLKQAMGDGSSLSDAFAETKVFPQYVISMSQIGETTGTLDQVMQELSKYYERETNMKEQLRTAITYPLMLLFMMFAVVAVLVFKVLPIFQDVLRSLGTNLSDFALTFMQVGQVLAQIGFVSLLVLLLGVFILWLCRKQRKHDSITNMMGHFFLTKKLYYDLSIAQVTYILALFQNSGADCMDAFHQMSQMPFHKQVLAQIKAAANAMGEGANFAKTIRNVGLYQGMEASMLEVGIRSGQQDKVLKQLADSYEQKVEQAIIRFLNILEPTIVAMLSILVGMVLLSVMLPLMGIMSSAG